MLAFLTIINLSRRITMPFSSDQTYIQTKANSELRNRAITQEQLDKFANGNYVYKQLYWTGLFNLSNIINLKQSQIEATFEIFKNFAKNLYKTEFPTSSEIDWNRWWETNQKADKMDDWFKPHLGEFDVVNAMDDGKNFTNANMLHAFRLGATLEEATKLSDSQNDSTTVEGLRAGMSMDRAEKCNSRPQIKVFDSLNKLVSSSIRSLEDEITRKQIDLKAANHMITETEASLLKGHMIPNTDKFIPSPQDNLKEAMAALEDATSRGLSADEQEPLRQKVAQFQANVTELNEIIETNKTKVNSLCTELKDLTNKLNELKDLNLHSTVTSYEFTDAMSQALFEFINADGGLQCSRDGILKMLNTSKSFCDHHQVKAFSTFRKTTTNMDSALEKALSTDPRFVTLIDLVQDTVSAIKIDIATTETKIKEIAPEIETSTALVAKATKAKDAAAGKKNAAKITKTQAAYDESVQKLEEQTKIADGLNSQLSQLNQQLDEFNKLNLEDIITKNPSIWDSLASLTDVATILDLLKTASVKTSEDAITIPPFQIAEESKSEERQDPSPLSENTVTDDASSTCTGYSMVASNVSNESTPVVIDETGITPQPTPEPFLVSENSALNDYIKDAALSGESN